MAAVARQNPGMVTVSGDGEVARPDGSELRSALRGAARAVDGLLRGLDRTDAVTAGGQWTVRETAAHLVAVGRLYASLLAGAPSPIVERTDNALVNAGVFLALAEDRAAALADLLAAAVAELDAAVATVAPEDVRPWHRGLSAPAAVHVALAVNELLMHGTDIARAAGVPWDGDDEAADVVWRVLAPWLTPLRFLPEAAGEVRVTITLATSGGPQLGFTVADGVITAAEPAAEVGCRIEGSPMALLRWYYQRDAWPEAGLRASGAQAAIAERFAELLRRV